MDAQTLNQDFRARFPKVATATDAKHAEVWGNGDHKASPLWFETLATVLNTRMGLPEHRPEIKAIFVWCDQSYRTGDQNVKKCIDANFVENLFWDVPKKNAAPVWDTLPKGLQALYLAFHSSRP